MPLPCHFKLNSCGPEQQWSLSTHSLNSGSIGIHQLERKGQFSVYRLRTGHVDSTTPEEIWDSTQQLSVNVDSETKCLNTFCRTASSSQHTFGRSQQPSIQSIGAQRTTCGERPIVQNITVWEYLMHPNADEEEGSRRFINMISTARILTSREYRQVICVAERWCRHDNNKKCPPCTFQA
jgi:hypothetical protein